MMPKDHCPVCLYEFDDATNLTGETRPSAGDVTICFRCGALLVFAADLRVITPSRDVHREIMQGATGALIRRVRAEIRARDTGRAP